MLLAVCVLLVLYSICIEPYWVEVTQHDIFMRRLPSALDGLRVVQLTDFHFPVGLPVSYYRRVVALANNQHADLIVLTGDYIARSAEDAESCAAILRELHAPLGVWAVLGNHDYWTNSARMRCALEAAGIHVLVNKAVPIRARGTHCWLVGLDDTWSGHPNTKLALRGVPPGEASIALVHEPDYADTVARFPVDVQLSGHSHGGQVRIPLIQGLLLPRFSRRYPVGFYTIDHLILYTSRGIGGVSVPLSGRHLTIRFNCRPEITVLTLRR